jgi:MFS family permease
MSTSNLLEHPDPAKLRALPWSYASTALNTFFYMWTFGGSIFPLFLSELGLPKDRIGLLMSFFPFTGLVALFISPTVTRWGRKRIFLIGFGVRKFVMASILFLPWLLNYAGRNAAFVFLTAIIFSVALLRATAETGYYPWMQEFVPNQVRGRYWAISSIVQMLCSTIALAIASRLILKSEGLNPYLMLIGIGAGIGLIGVLLMGLVPGGEPVREVETSSGQFTNLWHIRQDSNFMFYLGGIGLATLGAVALSGFLSLYLKEKIGLPPGMVVSMDIVWLVGGLLSSLICGVAADRVGSKPVLIPLQFLSAFIPLGWLLVPRHSPDIGLLCGVLYFGYGAFANGSAIGAARLLFNSVIPVEKNTSYTSIHYAWMGLIGGLTPLLAGKLLSTLSAWQISVGSLIIDAYSILFLLSLVGFIGSTLLYRQVRPDGNYTIRNVVHRLIRRKYQGYQV